MEDVTVMFSLPQDAFKALQEKAQREGSAPGALLRKFVRQHLKDTRGKQTEPLVPIRVADPTYAGALRTLLGRDFADAESWDDLEHRLGMRGYHIQVSGNRLSIHTSDHKRGAVDTNEIGASYGALMRRFNGPIPKSLPR